MLRVDTAETFGWEAAIRGMRNPLNSWSRSDSTFEPLNVGEADLALMRKLCAAGSEHCKFMRCIIVSMDVTAPLYWWKEMETYKVGTVSNACSTMHKISSKPFSMYDFSTEHMLKTSLMLMQKTVDALNFFRNKYNVRQEKEYWWQMIQLLPSSYNQRRTLVLNYEVLRNIYHQRKDHKLDEWHTFCGWIRTLPYSELITVRESAPHV